MSERTYTYKRFMRDGSVQEKTGIRDLAKRVRKGKTARDKGKQK